VFELKKVHMFLFSLKSSACCPRSIAASAFAVALLIAVCSLFAQQASAKVMGTVKSVNGSSIVLTTDSGAEVTVTVGDGARIIRATPGQDLKSAPQIQVSDIQVGDRVLAVGPVEGQSTGTATTLVVMKQSDVSDIHQKERDEWRRGVGGIVKEVDTSAGTITIANSLAAGGKPIVIHVGADTEIKRYSPDSVKFDDAKPSTLDQIKPGDQVRARGTKSADGTEFTAQAIVSGSFKDVAGTVISTDAAKKTVTISDLATKKPVTIKVGPDSLLRKLPPFVAMGIAMRLKGGAPGAGPGGAPSQAGNTSGAPGQSATQGGNRNWQGGGDREGQGQHGAGASGGAPGMGGPGGNWRGNGGPPDFQQMLARMPAVAISDLNKGDAVMLVATEGSENSQPTAITLLAGVEPILSSAPAGTSASTILSPWNLGQPAAAGGDAATQ
jgi:hypothetical protein